MGGFKNKQALGFKSEEREKEFTNLVDEVAFRALRKDWGVYQGVDYETVQLNMSPEQKLHYGEMEHEFVTYLSSGEEISAVHAAAKYMKLQQIASGFVYDEFKESHLLMPFEKTEKFKELTERIEERSINKTLVIAHMRPTLGNLRDKLSKYNPAFILGKQDQKKAGADVNQEKERFNNDPECRVMIAQGEAVKYGHTLMGTETHPCLNTVFYENNFNLDTRRQCEERTQGSGQVADVTVTDYVSSNIEAHVIKALQEKLDVAKAAMGYAKELKDA